MIIFSGGITPAPCCQIRYLSVQLYTDYSRLSDSFGKIHDELEDLLGVVEGRGRDLHQGLISLNDTVLQGYLGLLGDGGDRGLAGRYALRVSEAVRATRDLDKKAQRFAPLLRQLRHSHSLMHADFCHYSRVHPNPEMERGAEAEEYLIWYTETIDDAILEIIDELEHGANALEQYLRRAQRHQPSPELEMHEIREAIEADILRAGKGAMAFFALGSHHPFCA